VTSGKSDTFAIQEGCCAFVGVAFLNTVRLRDQLASADAFDCERHLKHRPSLDGTRLVRLRRHLIEDRYRHQTDVAGVCRSQMQRDAARQPVTRHPNSLVGSVGNRNIVQTYSEWLSTPQPSSSFRALGHAYWTRGPAGRTGERLWSDLGGLAVCGIRVGAFFEAIQGEAKQNPESDVEYWRDGKRKARGAGPLQPREGYFLSSALRVVLGSATGSSAVKTIVRFRIQ
jgi:hypothetical protein